MNIIRITYYSYLYSGTILDLNIICIRIRPNICAQILFVFVFDHYEKTNIICTRIRSKFWFRILFVFVFGPKNSIRSPLAVWNKKKFKRGKKRRRTWTLESWHWQKHLEVVVEDKGRQTMGSGIDKDLVEMCWRSILALGTSFVRYPISVNYTKDPN